MKHMDIPWSNHPPSKASVCRVAVKPMGAMSITPGQKAQLGFVLGNRLLKIHFFQL